MLHSCEVVETNRRDNRAELPPPRLLWVDDKSQANMEGLSLLSFGQH